MVLSKDQREKFFLANGGLLHEKLIELTNGIYNPFRRFSVKELEKATNNYAQRSFSDGFRYWYRGFFQGRVGCGSWYRGFFQGRVVSICKPYQLDYWEKRISSRGDKAWAKQDVDEVVNDIAITAQTSGHKNVLKLLGCCLETPIPILVYESTENGNLFDRICECSESHPEAIPWKIRLKIAAEVAHVVAYLHTAFPRRIIHGSIHPSAIFLDEEYNAKLCDFSQSISIPQDEVGKASRMRCYTGYYLPCCLNRITEQYDVYSFGTLLLVLLIGREPSRATEFGRIRDNILFGSLNNYIDENPLRYYVTCHDIDDIVDGRMLAEGRGIDEQQQWRAVKELALSCLQKNTEKWPTMEEVTKQLWQIQRSIKMVAETHRSILDEGSMPMEKFIASCNSNGHLVHKFSAEELKRAARNYDPCCIFGRTDLGMWYNGSLDEQAISICKVGSSNWQEHVENEFKIAPQSSAHRHLLKLLGCCLETSVPTLVYESTENGNLFDQIYIPCGPLPQPMLWNGKLKISQQIADGIAFLHTAFSTPIIHGGVKLSNIFLDENYDAKISNFSHSVLINGRETQKTNSFAGMQSSLSPEDVNDTEISEKTDVHSFGILLYNALIGRRPFFYPYTLMEKGGFRLWVENANGNLSVRYLKYYFQCHCIDDVVDPRSLNMGEGPDQWQEVVEITFRCMDEMAEKRPTMVEVAKSLGQIERSLTTGTARELSILEHGRVFMEGLVDSYRGMFRPPLQFFSTREIKEATNNYDPEYIFNCSNVGIWYKGCVGHQSISVCKIRKTNWKENVKNEMEFASQSSARKNVLKLIGCCLETPVPALVYEGAMNGTLLDQIEIFPWDASLPLNKRLKIATQIANEVASLHLAFPRPIIHRNIKSASIYLGKHWVPKLSNFSQSVSIGQNETFVAERIEGSKWYLAPEFLNDGVVSEKLDVYSFGVVLIGLLMGSNLSCLFDLAEREGGTLLSHLENYVRSHSINEVVGQKKVKARRKQRKLEEMVELAISCMKTSMEERPTMAQVARHFK